MSTAEIIIKLILGGGFLLNGIAGVVTKQTQFGLSTGRSHLWGFAVNFHGEAAFVFNGTLLLCGVMIAGQSVYELLVDEGFSRSTRSVITNLTFVILFMGLLSAAVVQFATSLGESYRATMEGEPKSKRENPDDVEDNPK